MQVQDHPLAGNEIRTLVLSQKERATLRRASLILHRIRELHPYDEDDFVTDVALAAYVCGDVAADADGMNVTP